MLLPLVDTSSDRWQDEHPLQDDADFVHPPPLCVPGADAIHTNVNATAAQHGAALAATQAPKCGILFYSSTFFISDSSVTSKVTASADACCALCESMKSNCSHWTYGHTRSQLCEMWAGRVRMQHAPSNATSSGVMFHPGGAPPHHHPPAHPHNDSRCHANSYSTTLYGEVCLQILRAHDASTPFFLYRLRNTKQAGRTPALTEASLRAVGISTGMTRLAMSVMRPISYFPIQAVHTPYDAVPFNPTRSTYEGMLWDSDVYVGAITNLLR
jgi:hypothetical protein